MLLSNFFERNILNLSLKPSRVIWLGKDRCGVEELSNGNAEAKTELLLRHDLNLIFKLCREVSRGSLGIAKFKEIFKNISKIEKIDAETGTEVEAALSALSNRNIESVTVTEIVLLALSRMEELCTKFGHNQRYLNGIDNFITDYLYLFENRRRREAEEERGKENKENIDIKLSFLLEELEKNGIAPLVLLKAFRNAIRNKVIPEETFLSRLGELRDHYRNRFSTIAMFIATIPDEGKRKEFLDELSGEQSAKTREIVAELLQQIEE